MTTTPTLREAAQQALEALEKLLLAVDIDTVRMLVDDEPFDAARTTLDAVRAALAEQAAEQAVDREFELGVCESLDAAKALPDAPKDRWLIRFNNDGEFGCATGWLYRDGGEPCIVTGNPVYVWRPLDALLATTGHKIVREGAQAAEPAEPVSVRDLISRTIGFGFEVGELQTVNADDLLRLAAALCAAPPAPARQEPLTEEQRTVIDFLLGEGPLRGAHFGDETPEGGRGRFWWRNYLRAAFCPAAAPITAAPAEGGAA